MSPIKNFRNGVSLLGVAVLLFVFLPPQVEAASVNDFQMTENCDFSFNMYGTEDEVMAPQTAVYFAYQGIYPNQTTSLGGITGYLPTYGEFFNRFGTTTYSGTIATTNFKLALSSYPSGTFSIRVVVDGTELIADFEYNSPSSCVPKRVGTFSTVDLLDTPSQMNIDYKTRFISHSWNSPANDQYDLSLTYYLDSDEINTSVPSLNPTLVRICYSQVPNTTVSCRSDSIDNSITGTSTIVMNLTDIEFNNNQEYDYQIQFFNQQSAISQDSSNYPFPDTGMYGRIEIDNRQVGALSLYEVYDNFIDSDEEVIYNCSFMSLVDCIQVFFQFLFIPSTGFEYINDTVAGLQQKVPFNYIFRLQELVTTMSQQVGSFPVLTVQFNPSFPPITIMNPAWFDVPPWSTLFAFIRLTSQVVIYVTLTLTLYRRSRSYIGSLVGSELSYEVYSSKKR